MQIFLSHSPEQDEVTITLVTRLRADGHVVFDDATSLRPADSYDGRIRKAILACDLFIFLISPASVRAGRYALTELGIAQWGDGLRDAHEKRRRRHKQPRA